MLCKAVSTVSYQIQTQHRKTECGQNVDFLNAKNRGAYCNNWAL
jgi:hypothetical protein